ncbi:hypothetical protein OA46_01295 [Enterobacter cloacae]|nr:hypothetical protein OA46_01295 [Enterobacter cloacae]
MSNFKTKVACYGRYNETVSETGARWGIGITIAKNTQIINK